VVNNTLLLLGLYIILIIGEELTLGPDGARIIVLPSATVAIEDGKEISKELTKTSCIRDYPLKWTY